MTKHIVTAEMLNDAEEAYDQHARMTGGTESSRDSLAEALKAALEWVPGPVQEAPERPRGVELLTDTGMTRSEALEKATAIVDGWAGGQTERPRGPLGVVGGGGLDDRTTAVLRLAAFLTGSAGEV
jgi:hypothetical protein